MLQQTGSYDTIILEDIWKKASMLVSMNNAIISVPGEPVGSRSRMVMSASGKTPHHVQILQNNRNKFICDHNCPRFKAYKFCSHTIAVAEINGSLRGFMSVLSKGKSRSNLSSIVYHGLPAGAGEKGAEQYPNQETFQCRSIILTTNPTKNYSPWTAVSDVRRPANISILLPSDQPLLVPTSNILLDRHSSKSAIYT
jgi:hypothetical protein